MTTADISMSGLSETEHSAQLRRALIASTVGTTIEWYDFLLYGQVTGLVFGLAPAIQATKVDLTPALKETRAGAQRGPGRRLGLGISLSQALVASQIAISLLLVVAAGLFGRTLSNLHSVELGNIPRIAYYLLDQAQVYTPRAARKNTQNGAQRMR